MTIIPRVYQTMAVKAAVPALQKVGAALVVLATGLGKTINAALIAKKLKARRVLFLAHNNFILDNSMKEFGKVFDDDSYMFSFYHGTNKKGAKEADFVFASFQTMRGHLREWAKNHFDLVIIDESHHSHAETYRPVVEYFTCPRLGITATPDREDLQDIRELFGSEVINISLEEAIARGWLPRIEYHVITDESLDEKSLQKIAAEIREGKKRFTMAEVNRRIFIKKRDVEIARIIDGYNEKAIVFCNSITHAGKMVDSLRIAKPFHSKTGKNQSDTWDKNQEALSALKNGLIRQICAVNAFNEGIDAPEVGLVAFCRATSVPKILYQQLGRGMRPGKEKLIVLDFVGNLERVQMVLEMVKTVSDLHEKYTSKGEISREGYVQEKFEVSGRGFEFTFSNRVVDLVKVLRHCQRSLYQTLEEASQAAINLGIKNEEEYNENYQKDPYLPANPRKYSDFPGFPEFLNQERIRRNNHYQSWQTASKAAVRLNIVSSQQYAKDYRADPRLPSTPHQVYADFPDWNKFLAKDKYSTWQEASAAATALGFLGRRHYEREWKKDRRLPSSPKSEYVDFPGWDVFLRKEVK